MRVRNILILLIIMLVLGGAFYFTSRPKPQTPPEPRFYAWLIEMDDIEHIEISLPRAGTSQSFIKIPKEDTFPWYFDDSQHSAVDTRRWGGGIPLLLSGPGVERIISKDTLPEKLAEFGLAQPQMSIKLRLKEGKEMNIIVGDRTPDGASYYVQAPNTNDVALVDQSWFSVLERIVLEPPYAPPAEEEK